MTLLRVLLPHRLMQLTTLLGLAACLCLPAAAEDLEAGWVDRENILREEIVGAGIRTIDVMPEDGSRKVSIAVPKSAVKDRDDVHEVLVIGHRRERSGTAIQVRHEWATDYENDFYGLVIYLGKDTELPIRLYFKGEEPDSSHRPH